MAAATIIYCAPHTARNFEPFDRHQFYNHRAFGKRTAFDADGDAHPQTNLSFDDVKKCQISTHKFNMGRKAHAPLWAFNDVELRRVIVSMVEKRAYSAYRLPRESQLDQRTRLRLAEEKLQASIPRKVEVLDRLCHEFVECTDTTRRELLRAKIRELDSSIVHLQRGFAKLLATVLVSYYRLGHTSVDVAQATHSSATFVRQAVHRANVTWQQLQDPPVRKVNAASKTRAARKAAQARWARREGQRRASGRPGPRLGSKWSDQARARHAAAAARKRAERVLQLAERVL